jgi:hypothetical protein
MVAIPVFLSGNVTSAAGGAPYVNRFTQAAGFWGKIAIAQPTTLGPAEGQELADPTRATLPAWSQTRIENRFPPFLKML